MKKKNSQVFVLENIPYTAGAPVVITSGCLVKDGGSGRLRCQLGMACVNDDPIRAVTVLITPTDADGVTLSPVQQRFTGLSVRKDGTLSGKTELVLICIGAACAAGFLVGWVTPAVPAMLVLAVKYYAVYSCWGDFRRCHR